MSDDVVYLPPDPELTYRVATDASFPWGLRCGVCSRLIRDGQPFDTRPGDGGDVETIVCVYCPGGET
jgi:hypothetical protein